MAKPGYFWFYCLAIKSQRRVRPIGKVSYKSSDHRRRSDSAREVLYSASEQIS